MGKGQQNKQQRGEASSAPFTVPRKISRSDVTWRAVMWSDPAAAMTDVDPASSQSHYVTVDRPVFSRVKFDDVFQKKEEESLPVSARIRKYCAWSPVCFGKTVLGLFPFVETLRTYKVKKYLLPDLLAGLSVGMIHIPQGMGFAILTSVAPIYGLYSSFWPVVLYFLFGTSRHISVGTMAIISLVLGSVVEREAEHFQKFNAVLSGESGSNTTVTSLMDNMTSDAQGVDLEVHKASVASAVSLISGITMLVMGILRMGIMTTVMPTSFLGGFTTGAGIHITASQLSGLFGVKVTRYDGILRLPYSLIDVATHLPDTNIATLILSICCLIVLIFFKEFINERFKKTLPVQVPVEMILLAIVTMCSHFGSFSARWAVRTVGPVPSGIPAPFVPPLDRANTFMFEGITAGILCFVISISMADIFASKYKYQVDANQELIAYGLSYGISSFFHCFAGAAAPPRCFVNDSTGGKTQVSGLFTSLLLLLVLLLIGPLFRTLPNAVLSCIVIVAIFPLFKQFRILPKYWRLSKADFAIFTITVLSSVLLDLTLSLAVGISVSILSIIVASMMAPGYIIGPTKYLDMYAPANSYKNLRQLDGIIIFRYECTLYFATIRNFKSEIFKAVGNPRDLNTSMVKERKVAEVVVNGDGGPVVTVNGTVGGEQTGSGHTNGGPYSVVNVRKENGVVHTDVHTDGVRDRHAVRSGNPHTVILDCSPFGYVDMMGINAIRQLHNDYEMCHVNLVLAACCPGMLRKLELANLIGGERGDVLVIYHTVQDAVRASQMEVARDCIDTYL